MWCMDGVYIIDKLILCVVQYKLYYIIVQKKQKAVLFTCMCSDQMHKLGLFFAYLLAKILKGLVSFICILKKNHSNWNLHLCCVHYYLFCAWVIGEFNLLYVWMTTGDIDCPWNCVLSVNTAPFHPFQKANSLFFKIELAPPAPSFDNPVRAMKDI